MDLKLAEKYARAMMDFHGLQNWEFGFDYTTTYLGVCYFRKKLICLSEPYVLRFNAGFTIGVILHEIAHALAGNKAAHGPKWKSKAIELGADVKGYYFLPGRYQALCPSCKELHQQHRNRAGWYCACTKGQSYKNRLDFVDVTTIEKPEQLGYDPNPVKLCYPRKKRRKRRGMN